MNESGTHKPAPAYWAFISYSSKDRATARWLHRRIENYAIPTEFQSISFPDGTELGKHLRPVFRDRDELSGSADLGPAISRALSRSRYLIVLCSRNSARSTWVNKEILEFQAAGKEKNILALILDGEPNATSNPVLPDEDECFPPALRYPAEPLAGDLRKAGDGPERGFLKVLAGMTQLDFDGLYRRHERAQRRRRLMLSLVSLVVIVSLAGLAAVALLQKARAEREKDRAVRNEREAKQQRDLARSHLSRFYLEKARGGDISTEASLAWALQAAEINPGLLDSPGFQGQIAQWAGPFPGPDKCDPTGLKPTKPGYINLEFHLSRLHRRMFLQGTDSSWTLQGWDGEPPLAEGFTDGPIRFFVSPSGDPWFTLIGLRTAEVRSWLDGRLIARCELEGRGFIDAATATENELLLAMSEPSGEKTESRLYAWDPLHSEKPSVEGPVLEGDLVVLAAATRGETTRLLGIVRQNGENRRVRWVRKSPGHEWQSLPEPDNAPRVSYISPDNDQPPGVVRLVYDEHVSDVCDLNDGAEYRLSLAGEESLVGLRRNGSSMEAFIQTGGNGPQKDSIKRLDLANGTRTQVFGGAAATCGSVAPGTGMLVAWDDRDECVRVRRADGTEISRSIRLPDGLTFHPLTIHPVSERLVLIECYTFPDTHFGVALVDLNAKDSDGVYFLRVPGMRDWLAASVESPGGAKLQILSHDHGAVSSAQGIPSIQNLIRSTGEQSIPEEGTPMHLEVADDGVVRLLSMRKSDETSEIRWSKPGSDSPWNPTKMVPGSDPTITGDVNHLLVSDYGQSMLLDVSGKVVWKDEDPVGKVLGVIRIGGNLAVLHHHSLGISLLDTGTGKSLWTRPLEDSLDSIQVLENEGRFRMATSRLTFDGSPPGISLREWSLKDGAEMTICSVELEKLERFGSTMEIHGSSHPFLLVDQQTSGGELHDCTVYQPQSGKLVEMMHWKRAARVPGVALPDGRGILTDFSDAANRDHQAAVLITDGGALRRMPVPLPGPLRSMHVDPTGHRCLFVLEESMLLWDLDASRQIGGLISWGQGHQEIRPNHVYKPMWSNDGMNLYLSYSGSIYQLDGLTGELIRTRNEHRPATGPDGRSPEIEHVALSPDGSWLASVDTNCVVRLSRVNSTPMDLETLREFSPKAGGFQINEGGDLVPWRPLSTDHGLPAGFQGNPNNGPPDHSK